MNSQEIIDEFFIQDSHESNGVIRKSVLLSLKRDIEFCILLPGPWQNQKDGIELTPQQYTAVQEKLPTFTVVSLFCTSVDVLARAVNKSIPTANQNGEFFRNCAEQWFNLTIDESKELWRLRNGISHNYSLSSMQIAREYGYPEVVRLRPDGTYEFYLRAMYTTLKTAMGNIYNHLSSQTSTEKENTANYLKENGFFYTHDNS